MATAETRTQAVEMKAAYEQCNPGLRFVINESGRKFAVLETRTCVGCGREFTTAAIGEAGSFCYDCENRRYNETMATIRAGGEQAREQVRWADANDRWED